MDRYLELELVAALKRGDAAAFDRVYEHFRPRLFGFLVRLSGRRHLAEDLLQETWLRLATRAPALSDDTRVGAWLYTVARNLYLSYRRRQLLDADRVGELFKLELDQEQRNSPFEEAAASETERDLERALCSLPLPYREVILLVAVQGLSPAEAAQVCEIEPAALRKRLSRARAMLAERLPCVPTANTARKAVA